MIDSKYRARVLSNILKKNGVDYNLNQVTEELAELIVAINHYRRGRKGSKVACAEERVDVRLCLHILDEILMQDEGSMGYDNLCETIEAEKLARIEEQLKCID